MAVKLSQSLRQTQTLAMTPQLQQAIKLLTLTHLELTDLIAEEMVENPVLEEVGSESDKLSETSGDQEQDYLRSLEEQNREVDAEAFREKSPMEREDFDWNSYIETHSDDNSKYQNMATPDSDDGVNYENMVSQGENLADHLEWQLRMENYSDDELRFALSVIHNIKDDGYLGCSLEELIAESPLSREDSVALWEKILYLDPVGCGSTSLAECLLAQARVLEERSPLLEKIIYNHLEDVRKKDWAKITAATGASAEVIKETALLLQNFYPRPGRLVTSQETQYVVPDIFVKEVSGEFVVTLNDGGVPTMRISKQYKQMFKEAQKLGDKEASEYVKEKIRSADWLIKSIQNRQNTILKVAQAIVRQQENFFRKGPKFLRPMILKDVAQEIEMHESTVSRVTTNKYMHTPIGTFELKYFFSTGLSSKGGGEDVASEVVKLKIKEMIENENRKRPLSDQKISELLARENIEVARRTVAKYREMLGFDSSARRKEK